MRLLGFKVVRPHKSGLDEMLRSVNLLLKFELYCTEVCDSCSSHHYVITAITRICRKWYKQQRRNCLFGHVEEVYRAGKT